MGPWGATGTPFVTIRRPLWGHQACGMVLLSWCPSCCPPLGPGKLPVRTGCVDSDRSRLLTPMCGCPPGRPRNHPLFKTLFCEPVLVTQATKKEYSSELGSQNASQMEPKMESKRQRPTLTKHAQALSDCTSAPLGELHFHCFFRVPKKVTKSHLKKSHVENLAPKLTQQ